MSLDRVEPLALAPAAPAADTVRPVAVLGVGGDHGLRLLRDGRHARAVAVAHASEPGIRATVELLRGGRRLGIARIRRVPVPRRRSHSVDVRLTAFGRRSMRARPSAPVIARMEMTDRAGNRSVIVHRSPPVSGGGD